MSGFGPPPPTVVQSMDFWSAPDPLLTITTTATDRPLPDVVVAGLPAGAVVVRAMALLKYRILDDSSSAGNRISPAQSIQARRGANPFVNAIVLSDNIMDTPADTREAGDVLLGSLDVSAEVDQNATYNFQWADAQAVGNNLRLRDIQTGLRVWFRTG